jgi:hypothetical protein
LRKQKRSAHKGTINAGPGLLPTSAHGVAEYKGRVAQSLVYHILAKESSVFAHILYFLLGSQSRLVLSFGEFDHVHRLASSLKIEGPQQIRNKSPTTASSIESSHS